MARGPTGRYPRTIRRVPRVEVEVEPERRRRLNVRPQQLPIILVAGFAFVILIGTVLLSLPIASADREWTGPVTSLFVATSAVCVTGLTPVDTGTYWSGFGQAVILVLIQLGGFGFMTSATLLFLIFGWRVGLRERLFLSESLDLPRAGGVVNLVRRAMIFTGAAEAIGFIILTARFALDEPFPTALWNGLFHSISAFNNAGFDVFGNFRSLEERGDAVVLLTVSVLVLVGGIGYLVIEDLRSGGLRGLSLDSKMILRMTAALLAAGFIAVLILEWDTTLAGRALPDRLLQSWFHSVTPRTAGFNSLPTGEMNDETLFFTMALMFVGGASGSTAGGIKLGALAILIALTFSLVRGHAQPEASGREIRRADVDRALTVTILSATLVFVVALSLAAGHAGEFLPLAFEATSAFGTVGLSTGVTPDLTQPGLLIVTATMFIGRLGPLTLVLALTQRVRPQRRRLAEDRVRVG